MKAAVTEKLLRSLLAKGASHEPIWDEIPPHLEWRINKRNITGSVVGRVRDSGTRQPIRLRAGHFPTTPVAEGSRAREGPPKIRARRPHAMGAKCEEWRYRMAREPRGGSPSGVV